MVAKVDFQCQLFIPEINNVHFCYDNVNHVKKRYDRKGCGSLGQDMIGS